MSSAGAESSAGTTNCRLFAGEDQDCRAWAGDPSERAGGSPTGVPTQPLARSALQNRRAEKVVQKQAQRRLYLPGLALG